MATCMRPRVPCYEFSLFLFFFSSSLLRSLELPKPGDADWHFVNTLHVALRRVHEVAPTYPMIGSEMGSTTSDRGVYAGSSNVSRARGDGGAVPEIAASMQRSADCWLKVLTLPYVSGAFEWSGYDYKGEPVPNTWPDVNSHFGFLDIAGFLKERGYWQKVWLADPDPPEIHMFPHWNWAATADGARGQGHLAECDGLCRGSAGADPAKVTVFAFSNVPGGRIELLLNGQMVGNGTVEYGGWLSVEVPYAPGTLTARAYRANNGTTVIAKTDVTTTGAPASLRASIKDGVGAFGMAADGTDVALVMVEVLDSAGRVVPTADNIITFAVSTLPLAPVAAQIIGTGNGNPSSHTPDKSLRREAFNGLALAVVQSVAAASVSGGASGSAPTAAVTITASSPGLQDSSVDITLLSVSDAGALLLLRNRL